MTERAAGQDDPHDLVAGFLLDALDADEELRFRAHLPGCAPCRDEILALDPVMTELGGSFDVLPPSSIEVDLMAGLPGGATRVDAAATGRDPNASGVAMPEQGRSEQPDEPKGLDLGPSETDRARPRRRRWAVSLAAAAAFLLGVSVTALLDHSPADEAAQTEMHEIMQISAAPDAHVMPMDVPGSTTALVVSDSMDKGALVASDLPMPAKGRTYHLWTLMDDGSMHTAVAFRPDAQGRASEVLEAGVRDAAGFLLTVEQPGAEHPTSPPIAQVQT